VRHQFGDRFYPLWRPSIPDKTYFNSASAGPLNICAINRRPQIDARLQIEPALDRKFFVAEIVTGTPVMEHGRIRPLAPRARDSSPPPGYPLVFCRSGPIQGFRHARKAPESDRRSPADGEVGGPFCSFVGTMAFIEPSGPGSDKAPAAALISVLEGGLFLLPSPVPLGAPALISQDRKFFFLRDRSPGR